MISEACALEQLDRLSQTFRLPADERAQNELIEAYRDVARDEQNAARITTHLLQTVRYCPVPADIRLASLQIASGESSGSLPEWKAEPVRCKECGGTGWTRTYEIHTRVTETVEMETKDGLNGTAEVFVQMTSRQIADREAKEIERGKRALEENERLFEFAARCKACGKVHGHAA